MTTQNTEAPTSMAAAVDLGVQAANADAGVTQETPDASENTEVVDETPADGDDAAAAGGDTDGAAGGDGVPGGDAAAAGDGEAAAADGEIPAGGDEGEDADAAAGKDGQAAGTKKDPDPLNDPIPAGLKEATHKRITDLVKIGKDQTQRADRLEQQFSTIVTRVRDTGSTPEQYGQALTYLTMVNSGKREDILAALEFIEGERIALARMAGVPLAGVSMVGDYPDIAAELKAGKITPERAEELAAQRAATEYSTSRQKHNDQLAATRNAHQAAVRTAQGELNAEEARLMKADPAYKAKRPAVLKIVLPLIRSGKLKPNEWLPEFQRVYKEVAAPVAAKPPAGGKPAAGGKPQARQPLRATQPAGGQAKAPKTMAEAVELGIAMGSR